MAIKLTQTGRRQSIDSGSPDGIIAYNPNYPDAIFRLNWEKHGERPSVKDYGAKGDTKLLLDGSVSATTTTFTSALASFVPSDTGKIINISGAGIGGLALGTTIGSVTDANTVELSDPAATTVSDAEFAYGPDDTPAFLLAIESTSNLGRPIFIPAGRYTITDCISMLDLEDFGLVGDGACSILLASQTFNDATNLIDVSGSRRLSLTNFCIDGRFLQRESVQSSAVYGDGTDDHPEYGDITLQNVTLLKWEHQGFGVGANVDKTVSGVRYLDMDILDFGSAAFGAHPIDTGSGGTKISFVVRGCRIYYQHQPAASPFNAIFCGHGKNYDFLVANNIIVDSPYDGIQFYSRPFEAGDNDGIFTGVVCSGNLIIRPRASGVALYGVKNATITGNTIVNPGQSVSTAGRSGVVLTWGFSDDASTIKTACENVCVSNNSIVDNQGSPTMQFGVYSSSDPSAEVTGLVSCNQIVGAVQAPIAVDPDDGTSQLSVISITDSSVPGIGIGIPSPRLPVGVDIRGDVRQEPTGPNFGGGVPTFNALVIDSARASGNYLFGHGFNVRFDPSVSKWKSGYDGANNALGAILFSQGDGMIRVMAKTTAGDPSAPQELTAAQMDDARILGVHPDRSIRTFGQDLRFARDASPNVFVAPLLQSMTTSEFYSGWGFNCYYDSVANLWKSGYDGSNNGCAAILMAHGGDVNYAGALRFFTKGTTGGSSQSHTNAAFALFERARLTASGYFGVGIPNPTARLNVVGSSTVAPLKIESSTLLTSAQNGAMEFDGAGLYFTVGGVRRSILGGVGLQIKVKGTGTSSESIDVYDIEQTSASSTLTMTVQPSDGHTVVIDGVTYTFRNVVSSARDVARYPTAPECLYNLFAAINDVSAWEGYLYGTGTAAHSTCEAEPPTSTTIKVKRRTPGAAGNGTTVSASSPMSWSPSPMSGGSDGTAPHKYIRVSAGALTVRNNAFTSDIWQVLDTGEMRVFGVNSTPPGNAGYAVYGKTVIRFNQGATDESNSGSIQYTGGVLWLVGGGSSGSNRSCRIFDHLGIGYNPPTTANGGNLAVAGWIGVGTNSQTSGKIFEVVGGTARFAAGVQIEGALYMPALTANTVLGLDAGNIVTSVVVPISSGGTGAVTAGSAVSNLGAAFASHSHTSSDMSGRTGDFTVKLEPSGSITLSFVNGILVTA